MGHGRRTRQKITFAEMRASRSPHRLGLLVFLDPARFPAGP